MELIMTQKSRIFFSGVNMCLLNSVLCQLSVIYNVNNNISSTLTLNNTSSDNYLRIKLQMSSE